MTARWPVGISRSCRHRGRPVTRAWLGNVAGNKCQPLWSPTELASIVTVEARTPSQAIENKRKFGSPKRSKCNSWGFGPRCSKGPKPMRWASLSDSSALARTSPVLNPANRRIRTRMSEGVQSRGCPLSRERSLPSRYANRPRSRFKFLLPPVGRSPTGDMPPDVVLRFVADPSCESRVRTLPGRSISDRSAPNNRWNLVACGKQFVEINSLTARRCRSLGNQPAPWRGHRRFASANQDNEITLQK